VKLGIVGAAREKFTPETEKVARERMREIVLGHRAEIIVSGRSPLGGIDVWAEDLAEELDLETRIFEPSVRRWDGPGGFRKRNLMIASESDLVLVVVVKDYPPGYDGMRFEGCYHCRDRNPSHVKSGGCWTAWKAKAAQWCIIP